MESKTAYSENWRQSGQSFFSKDLSAKMEYNYGSYGGPMGGYTPIGLEAVGRSNDGDVSIQPDIVESFVYNRNALQNEGGSDASNSLAKLSYEYFGAMEQLLQVLHTLSGVALEFNGTSPMFEGFDGKASDALRFANYPALNDAIQVETGVQGEFSAQEEPQRYAPHTDYQGFTILCPDPKDWSSESHGGLEILMPNSSGDFKEGYQTWIKANLTPYSSIRGDILVVNAGDLVQRSTNDYWKSAYHRVVSPAARTNASLENRMSFVFFSGPTDDSLISTLPLDYLGDSKYDPISAGSHLKEKLERTKS